MSRLPVHQLQTNIRELDLGEAKVYHLPQWDRLTHPQKLAVIRQIATMRGRDPRIARLAVSIIKRSGAQPRQYEKQAAALLRWVQNPKNCYYVNEPGERLQDPVYTLEAKHGDCDDCSLLLCSLFESVRLPWRLVLSGRAKTGQKIRYIEGDATVPDAVWAHIYCMVGVPPYQGTRWWFCEPTVVGVPLGWDVVDGDASFLPEMGDYSGSPRLMPGPRAPRGWRRPGKLPPPENRSPAYGFFGAELPVAYASPYGGAESSLGPIVGALSSEFEQFEQNVKNDDWRAIAKTVAIGVGTGVAVSVLSAVVTPMIKNYLGIKDS